MLRANVKAAKYPIKASEDFDAPDFSELTEPTDYTSTLTRKYSPLAPSQKTIFLPLQGTT